MVLLNENYYAKLAQELTSELYGKEITEGVIELDVRVAKNSYAEVIFAYCVPNHSLDRGIEDICFMVIAILDGKRHSTDFDEHRFLIYFND